MRTLIDDKAAHLALKRAGQECYFYDCWETSPQHGITWKCNSGHRLTLWYCTGHIEHMMNLATRPGPGRMYCRLCSLLTYPVIEGGGFN